MNVQTLYFIQTCLEINDVHTLVMHTSVVDSPRCLVSPDALKCHLSSPLGYSSAFLNLIWHRARQNRTISDRRFPYMALGTEFIVPSLVLKAHAGFPRNFGSFRVA